MMMFAGLIVVFGAVAGGYLMHGGVLMVLWQPAELVIIGGAALGSLIVSTPPRVLKEMMVQLKTVMAGPPRSDDYVDLLALLYKVFKQAQQQGVMALEPQFENPHESPLLTKHPKFMARHHSVSLLADSIKIMIVGGIQAHDLEALLDEDLHAHHDAALAPSKALNRIGDALPGLGIVAAVLGVVITMGHIDGPPAEIGEKIGAALIGTFLGILLSYGAAQPVASALEQRVADDEFYNLCIKAGLMALHKGHAPAVAIEFARRVLPHAVRPSFEETEKFCRAATSPSASQQAA
jgi:chemotaxis protein MotA